MIRALLISALLITPASAHNWYASWCCNGDAHTGDCQEIPSEAVTPIEGGWRVILRPGDHRKVTKTQVYFVPYKNEEKYSPKVRQSQDNQFHACLFPSEETLRCLYVPPMGV